MIPNYQHIHNQWYISHFLPNGKCIIKGSLYYGADNIIHNIPTSGYLQRVHSTYTVQLPNTGETNSVSLIQTSYSINNIYGLYLDATWYYNLVGTEGGSAYYSALYLGFSFNTDRSEIYHNRNNGDSVSLNSNISDNTTVFYVNPVLNQITATYDYQGLYISSFNMYINVSLYLWVA